MSANDEELRFGGLVDLAAESLGGVALACSDEFFAGMDNLLKPGRGEFRPGVYTEHGKWMDGWESGRTRRRSRLPDRDYCIVRLGAQGTVRALEIDTNHFLGNHPPYASVEACTAPWDAAPAQLEAGDWQEILPQSPLRPGARNLFAVTAPGSFTHVRLTIYPDGGVARLRVHGVVDPAGAHPRERDTETARRVAPDLVDLVALHGGGQALACSDMFFGAMHQLIQPGRARHMGEGWETRRRRAPGHDWILLALAGRGVLDTVELDTNHFKGNYPDECALEGILAPGARITDLIASSDWQPVLPRMPLEPSTRHWYRDELVDGGPFTHLRLSIYPDGGISRLRAWGRLV